MSFTFQVYEGAVYMHQGSTYLVEDLDLPSRTALCRKADLKYYTKTRDYTDIHVIGSDLVCPYPVNSFACNFPSELSYTQLWRNNN